MIRRINRQFQDWMRKKRLKLGKHIWDKKEKEDIKYGDNFLEDNNIKSILFLRYDGKIGDMVINTIMLREIKKNYPNIKIGVVTRGGAKDIIEDNKNVDKIYNYNKKTREIKKLANEITEEKYDLLIDFGEMLRVHQMMFINLCKVRINMGVGREAWNLFDVSVPKATFNYHVSKLYIDILNFLGIKDVEKSYEITPTDYIVKNQELENKRYILFNPYAASKRRSFNLKNILKISEICLEKSYEKLVLIGTSDHTSELEKTRESLGERVVIARTKNILEVAELVKEAALVITPDTSIVHIAAAFDKNMIAIYRKEAGVEDKNALLWGPNYDKAKVIFVEGRETLGENDVNNFDINKLERVLTEKSAF